MKKSLGVYGFYVGLASIISFVIGVVIVAIEFVLVLVTFGFIADSSHSILNSVDQITSFLFHASIILACISVPFLIIGKVQYKRSPDIFTGDRLTNVGILFSIVIIGLNVLGFAYEFAIKVQNKSSYDTYLTDSLTIPVTCDSKTCENPVLSREENTLAFTLINNYPTKITLTGFSSPGSCKDGYIETYQTAEMTAPVKPQSGTDFSIVLNPAEHMKVLMKCQDIVRVHNDFFEGPDFWMLSSEGQKLYFHINMTGPRLEASATSTPAQNPTQSKSTTTPTSRLPACPLDQKNMTAPCTCPSGKIAFNACVYTEGDNGQCPIYRCQ